MREHPWGNAARPPRVLPAGRRPRTTGAAQAGTTGSTANHQSGSTHNCRRMRTWKVRSSDAGCQLPLVTGRARHAARRPCSMLAPDLPTHDLFGGRHHQRYIPRSVSADDGFYLWRNYSGSAFRIAASINSDTVSPCWMAAIFALRYTSTSSARDVFVRRGPAGRAASEAENVSETGRMGAAARGRKLRLTGSDLPLI